MKKILIIEDDPSISLLLARTLEMVNFLPVRVSSITEAYVLLKTDSFDLMILDLGLPDGDGMQLLSGIVEIPVIILTARAKLHDKIQGLSSGADDYLTKPFEPIELIARIKAVLRRYTPAIHKEYQFDDITMKIDQRIVSKDKTIIDLTPKEFDLLYYLTENNGFAVRREKLIEKVWGYESDCTSRTVDIHVQRLRKKLSTKRIETVYKIGYRFNNA